MPVFDEKRDGERLQRRRATDAPNGWLTARQAAEILGRPPRGMQTVLAHYGVPAAPVVVTIFGHTMRCLLYRREDVQALRGRLAGRATVQGDR